MGLREIGGARTPQDQRGPWAAYSHDLAITITQAAFEAIRATLPDGAAGSVEPDGQMRIWLDHDLVDALRAVCRPRESYSDVILRLAKPVIKAGTVAQSWSIWSVVALERDPGSDLWHILQA